MKAIQMTLPLRFETRALLRCSMPAPDNRLHHLYFDRKKGWECRLTLLAERNGQVVSKRVRFRFGRRTTEDMAIAKRDVLIAGYRKIKLRVEERILVRGRRPEEKAD